MAKKQNYIWKNDRNFALDDYEKQQLYYVVRGKRHNQQGKTRLNCTRIKTHGLCHFKDNAR